MVIQGSLQEARSRSALLRDRCPRTMSYREAHPPPRALRTPDRTRSRPRPGASSHPRETPVLDARSGCRARRRRRAHGRRPGCARWTVELAGPLPWPGARCRPRSRSIEPGAWREDEAGFGEGYALDMAAGVDPAQRLIDHRADFTAHRGLGDQLAHLCHGLDEVQDAHDALLGIVDALLLVVLRRQRSQRFDVVAHRDQGVSHLVHDQLGLLDGGLGRARQGSGVRELPTPARHRVARARRCATVLAPAQPARHPAWQLPPGIARPLHKDLRPGFGALRVRQAVRVSGYFMRSPISSTYSSLKNRCIWMPCAMTAASRRSREACQGVDGPVFCAISTLKIHRTASLPRSRRNTRPSSVSFAGCG